MQLPHTVTQAIPSLHSWWSDSNPPGATISLHAAAKPLMKLLYHRQARKFIRLNRGAPLSRENMEVFASYLRYKYVSVKTKALVLEELVARAKSEEDAKVIAEVFEKVEELLPELLRSPDNMLKKWAWQTVETLATHKSTSGAATLAMRSCFVSLLSDPDANILGAARYALSLVRDLEFRSAPNEMRV